MIQDFPTGIGNYRESLIRALAKLGSDHSFILVGNSGNKMEGWAKKHPRFEFAAIKSKPNSIHQHFLLPFELAPLKLDLFWTTPWGASVFLRGKYALTIYDLLYRRYPEIASLKARLYEGLVSKWVARRAEIIFTISEFVKEDIEGFLRIKRDKIVNIRGAAGDAYFRRRRKQGAKRRHEPLGDNDNKHLVSAKHGIQMPFFVYLGNFRPHKNLATLLRAFANIKYSISNIKLVLIGDVDAKGRGQDSQNLLKLLKELNLQNEVILTGRIEDDREVAAILNEAVALVHPSFHEGFGLTVLEAMSCGTPVIAANATSIPEVVGQAGILVNPQSVDEFAEAMEKVFVDYHNPVYGNKYQSLVSKGLKQAKKFSWEKTARAVLETFSHLTI